MQIGPEETLRLAEMLRIRLSPDEAERFARDMSSVLDYVEVLNRLDTQGVDPLGVGLNKEALLREDVPGDSLAPSDLESLSGGAYDPARNAFVVQPVFE
ncbi:MAG: Asp-tRNA(Asn)/Glu-tRNA(Gln) amidotransferase subunit GatC [Planctomycetota bacterium]|jgi:aspartyl-tRNA(Asn)/glutamyl-tRNA(Gln) amidotransferase subunit C|nr:Asp-tRNA(Asn)/Glu-tRNA(Gln) amidotransferase subunit GatC [Planctomycetota bacterium]